MSPMGRYHKISYAILLQYVSYGKISQNIICNIAAICLLWEDITKYHMQYCCNMSPTGRYHKISYAILLQYVSYGKISQKIICNIAAICLLWEDIIKYHMQYCCNMSPLGRYHKIPYMQYCCNMSPMGRYHKKSYAILLQYVSYGKISQNIICNTAAICLLWKDITYIR